MNPDYDTLWEQQMRHSSFRGEGVRYWDEFARRYANIIRVSDYNDWLVRHMRLAPDSTVLDVGCGAGELALAIAGKVKEVTALDISPHMIETLQDKAARRGLKNVRTLCRDWEKVEIGQDVMAHDVVIASRVLPMGNLRRTLVKLNRAAARCGYVTWPAGANETDAAICAILGREYHPAPDFHLIAAILDSLGLTAVTRTFSVSGHFVFPDLDTAATHHLRGQQIDPALLEKVRDYLAGRLVPEAGGYRQETHNLWALIEWHKHPAQQSNI